MSPLAKKVIEVLKNENDEVVLAEVLDFYEYLKQKKRNTNIWENISEDEATEDEVNIINNYIKEGNKESVSLDSLVKDLGLDE